jgi:hypothetical protein
LLVVAVGYTCTGGSDAAYSLLGLAETDALAFDVTHDGTTMILYYHQMNYYIRRRDLHMYVMWPKPQ